LGEEPGSSHYPDVQAIVMQSMLTDAANFRFGRSRIKFSQGNGDTYQDIPDE
jgi:hypothetical protein